MYGSFYAKETLSELTMKCSMAVPLRILWPESKTTRDDMLASSAKSLIS